MSQSIDLLSRLQAATEGSAELDRAFLEALGWTFKWRWHRPNGLPLQHDERAPRPTRSLDDITRMIEEAGRWPAIYPKHDQSAVIKWQALIYTDSILDAHWGAFHADVRVALCLAFLRARATP